MPSRDNGTAGAGAGPTGGIVERPASRLIVLDPADRMLLFFGEIGYSIEPDRRPDATGFWALPGGAVDPGESYLEAAVRELAEEAGLVAPPGDFTRIALRDTTWSWKGRTYHALEEYWLVRVATSDLDTSGWQEGDRRWMTRLGWWRIPDLAATRDIVRPPGLAPLAARCAAGDVPTVPVVLPG